MKAGVRDILIIATTQDAPRFHSLLGFGSQWVVQISYEMQSRSEGLAHVFLLGEGFVGRDPIAMILGDNIF